MDKMKRFFTLDDDYTDYSADGSEESSVASVQATAVHRAAPQKPQKGNLVAIASAKQKPAPRQEFVVFDPRAVGRATDIAEILKQHKCVLLNFTKSDKDLCRRTIDFLTGVCYANGGSYEKVMDQVFLFVPPNMVITGPKGESRDEPPHSEVVPPASATDYKGSYPGGYR